MNLQMELPGMRDDDYRDEHPDLCLELSLRPPGSYSGKNSEEQRLRLPQNSPIQIQDVPQNSSQIQIQNIPQNSSQMQILNAPPMAIAGPNAPQNPGTNSKRKNRNNVNQGGNSRPRRRRIVKEDSEVPALFPWSLNRRCKIRSLYDLRSKRISKISGEVQCNKCQRQYTIEYNLYERFIEIEQYLVKSKDYWHDRAPSKWLYPVLQPCEICKQEKSVKPVIAAKKRAINWLFLFLGGTIGCCTLEQLKYLCKWTKDHRTGAKERVLYYSYLALWKQLNPFGDFFCSYYNEIRVLQSIEQEHNPRKSL